MINSMKRQQTKRPTNNSNNNNRDALIYISSIVPPPFLSPPPPSASSSVSNDPSFPSPLLQGMKPRSPPPLVAPSARCCFDESFWLVARITTGRGPGQRNSMNSKLVGIAAIRPTIYISLRKRVGLIRAARLVVLIEIVKKKKRRFLLDHKFLGSFRAKMMMLRFVSYATCAKLGG